MLNRASLRTLSRYLLRVIGVVFGVSLLWPAVALPGEFNAKTIANSNWLTVMEVEGDYGAAHSDAMVNSYPREVIAKEFYTTHPDQYDFLVFFTNFDFPLPDEAVAVYGAVKNDVRGIGLDPLDNSSFFGSSGSLQGIIDMGNLARLASDPLSPDFSTTMGTLSHELLHRWGAHVRYQTDQGVLRSDLLGRDGSHWSFLLDSKGSLEYGNSWRDNGNGTFTTLPGRKYFSPLDLYLMGVLDKSAVPPMLLIANPDVDPRQVSQAGVTIGGRADTVSIAQIIAAEGERIPDYHDSQKSFRIGCILLTRPGTYTPDSIPALRTVLDHWPVWFSSLTNGAAQVVVDAALPANPPKNPGPDPGGVDPRTVPPEINDGVAWLLVQQLEDGSWQDTPSTGGRDTAEAVRVLSNFPGDFADPASAVEYLVAAVDGNHDFVSRKIQALAALEYETTDLIAALLGGRNQDGGWGGRAGHVSNVLDTALLLRALLASGLPDVGGVSGAVAYLNDRQNPDGGWGREGLGSDLITTSNAIAAYSDLVGRGVAVTAQLSLACAWLQNRQHGDGGFGDTASTVYQTALAFNALRKAGIAGGVTDRALGFIAGAQAGNGSWNESVYETALAVEALWTAAKEPDLQVSSGGIQITPESVTLLPAQITLVAAIANLGLPNVTEVKVALYEGEMAPEHLLAEQVISVNGKATTPVFFPLTVTDGNSHRYLVVVDPENLIGESGEANNRTMKWLYPEATYELVLNSPDIQATPARVEYYQSVTVTSTVANLGTVDTFGVVVDFFLEGESSRYHLATRYVDIPAGGAKSLEFVWLADHPGENQSLTVVVDPSNAFAELVEDNNQAATLLSVQQTSRANLMIRHEDIRVSPSPALEGADATISISLSNTGFSSVQNAVVEFYSAKPDNSEKTLLGREVVPLLEAGGTTSVSHLWTKVPVTGDRIVSILVDPDNVLEEITKDDNQAFTELNILTLPDLTISANSITLSPPYPKEGEALTVQVAVQNNGGQAVTSVPVSLALDGRFVQAGTIPDLAGNSAGALTFTLSAAEVVSGVHSLQVELDPEHLVLERAEDNNRAEKEFGVQNGDLWLTERYFSPNGDGIKDATAFFFRLKKAQAVQVVVVDGEGLVVRRYEDPAWRDSLSGTIAWDGRSDKGAVVPDGEYQIRVVGAGGILLAGLAVTVDNNRSSILAAVGTEYLLQNNLSCMLPDFEPGQWFSDESGLLVSIPESDPATPDYPSGLYAVSPDGEDITRLIPASWTSGVDPNRKYEIGGYAIAPDDDTIAFVMDKSLFNPTTGNWENSSELWSVDRYGENLTLLAGNDFSVTGKSVYLRDPHWSPDGKYLAYLAKDSENSGSGGLWIIDRTWASADRFVPIAEPSVFFSANSWSPDGSRFAYWAPLSYFPGYDHLKVISLSDGAIFESQSAWWGNNTFSWLNSGQVIAAGSDWMDNSVWLFDVSGRTPEQALSEIEIGPLAVNRNGEGGVVFAEYNRDERQGALKYCDDTAQCRQIYLAHEYCGEGCTLLIPDLVWSPDGEKLAFIEWSAGNESGEWREDVHLVVMDPLHPDELKSFSLPSNVAENSLQWHEDSNTLLGKTSDGIFVVDSLKGTMGTIPVADSLTPAALAVSPFAKYLTYEAYVSPESICAEAGSRDLWAVRSLLNLTADLRAIKKPEFIELKGIASDRNFASYELEYAEVGTADWHTISPPSATMAVNKVLGQWVPPGKGHYYVRLTATDKAGNTRQNRIRLSWGFNTSITGLYQSTELFSPNGGGTKDRVEIHYRIMAPVHLDFTVVDKDNQQVASFRREYPEPPGVTGEDFITWYGRDGDGAVVPDGLYSIRVLDFEFPVEVDRTPPEVSLKINQTECEYDPIAKTDACPEPFVRVDGTLEDVNLLEWHIEVGEGDNPSEWWEVTSATTEITFRGREVAQLGNRKFRLTAVDAAGNKASATSSVVTGLLLIQGWRSKGENGHLLANWMSGFKFLYDQGDFDDSEANTDLISPPDSALGLSEIRVVETFGLPLVSGWVQEREGGGWRDGEEFSITGDGAFVVRWQNLGAEMIRLKVIDEQGGVHYSNSLRLPEPPEITLKSYCRINQDGVDEGVAASLSNTVGVRKIIYSYAHEGQDDWRDYRVMTLDLGKGYNQDSSFKKFYVDAHAPGFDLNGEYYTIRMAVYNEFGELIRTAYCRYPEICGKSDLALSYQPATTCNALAPGRVTLAHQIVTPDFVTVKEARYLIGAPISPEDYLKNISPPTDSLSLLGATAAPLPVDTSGMAEGVYPVRSEVTFAYGPDHFVSTGDQLLAVDRRVPEINLTAPAAGQKVCPVKVTRQNGSVVNVVAVNGTGADYFSNSLLFHAAFALAATPDQWQTAPLESMVATAQSYSGQWGVDSIRSPDLALKLAGSDWVGNLGCAVNSFELDTVVAFHDAHTDKTIFSPNNDGVLDEVAFDFTVDEEAKADLLIIVDSGDKELGKPVVVRKLMRQEAVLAGVASGVSWDGMDDNTGEVALDGEYAAYLILTDSCGNQRKGVIGRFVLDATPPEAAIYSPVNGAQVGGVVELSGAAADANFASYTLSLDPVSANVFQNLSPSPVRGGVLGTWQAFGLDGLFTITLTVSDTAGNTSTAAIEVQRSLNDNLIKQFSLAPVLFSPNGDLRLEETHLQYELNPEIVEPLAANLTILNEEGEEVWSYQAGSGPGGTLKSVIWEGLNFSGEPVVDGRYLVSLKAYYPAAPEVFQVEQLSVEVDANPPEISIAFPTPQSYLAVNPLRITGSVSDAHLSAYKLTLAGASGVEVVDQGEESRLSYLFGTLSDLDDGPYTLTVAASDLGESSASKTISFVLDRTAPEVVLDTPLSGAVYGGEERNVIAVEGAISELNLAHWQLRYTRKGSPLLPVIMEEGDALPTDTEVISGSLPVGKESGLADGTYLLSLFAGDKAGLKGERIVKVDVDNTSPDLAISEPGEDAWVTAAVDLVGTVKDPHLADYTLEIAAGDCAAAYEWSPVACGSKAVEADRLGRWQTMPPDGDYCLRLAGRDQLGNAAETSRRVKVDTHPPAPPLLSGQLPGGDGALLSWSGNSEADLAGYNLYRDGNRINSDLLTSMEYLDLGLAEGSYGWQVTAVDQAGLESGHSQEVRLRVDLSPPEARILSPDDGGTVVDQVSIKGTAFSREDFKEYRLFVGVGAAPAAWQLLRKSPVPVNYGELARWDTAGLSDGLFSLKLDAEDLSGNVNTHQVTVTVDNRPPQAPVLTGVAARGPLSAEVDIVWDPNGERDLAGYLLYRNEELANAPGLVTGNLKPYLLAATSYGDLGLPDGTFEYYLLAMDAAGNLSEPSNVMTVAIDTHPPHLQIVTPAAGEAFEHTLVLTGKTADLDIATVQFQCKGAAGGGWTDLVPPLTAPPYLTVLDPEAGNLGYGDFVIRAMATDRAGNSDPTPQEVAVRYADLTPPAAPLNLRHLTLGDAVTLTWDANTDADLHGYNVYWLNGSTSPLNIVPIQEPTFQHQGLADGGHLYQITALDVYGNESPVSNQIAAKVYRPFLIQPSSPVGVVGLDINGSQVQAGDQIELFNDTGAGALPVGTVTADQDGNFVGRIVLSPGDNLLTARAADGVGNISNFSAPIHVVYDEPPASPTGLSGTVSGSNVTLNWNANREPDLAGYHLYRDGEVIRTKSQIDTSTATLEVSDQYNLARNVVDGNPNTYWSTYYFNYRWLQVDFGAAEQLIDTVELDWHSTYFPHGSLVVMSWKDNTWHQEYIVGTNTQAHNKIKFAQPVLTSRLYLYTYIPSYWSYVYLSEMRIFGEVPLLITTTNFSDLSLPDGRHHYQISAVDTMGLESPLSPVVMVPLGDVTPPAPPTNLTAAAVGAEVVLGWDANGEADLAGYALYREEAGEWRKINGEMLTLPGFTENGLADGSYLYRVTAVDKVGNESEPSEPATCLLNIVPPSPPSHLTVTPVATGAALMVCWQGEAEAVAYNLYRGSVAGGPYDVLAASSLTETCFQDEGLGDGATYYYVVTALDRRSSEGAFSDEAFGTTLLPDPLPGSPPAPLILYPVIGGGEVLVSEPFTTVSGLTEPGATVELYREGMRIGATQAAAADAVEEFAHGKYLSNSGISPDGGRVAYRYYDYASQYERLAVYDYGTGKNLELAVTGPMYRVDVLWWEWSPDGREIAVRYDNDLGGYGIVLFALDSGDSTPVLAAAGYAGIKGWSPDGQRLAIEYSDEAGNWRTAVFAVEVGQLADLLIPEGKECSFSAWSPDGRKISLDCYEYVSDWSGVGLYDLGAESFSGINLPVGTESYAWGWSPDGTKLAFEAWDDQDVPWEGIYNTQDGTIVRVDFAEAISYGDSMQWSPDSAALLFTMRTDTGAEKYLGNPADGATVRILDDHHEISSAEWLPDGSALIVSAYSLPDDRSVLYRYTVGQEAPVALAGEGDSSSFRLSPTGSRLAYVDGERLNVLDLVGNAFTVYDDAVAMFSWSRDGRQIAFTTRTQTGDDLWLLALDAPAPARRVYRGSAIRSWVSEFAWEADGRISLVNSSSLVRIVPAGYFSFPAVPLPNPKNILAADAIDSAGNTGPFSEAITVKLAPAALPDPAISADDIYVVPLAPVAGESVRIGVVVRNPGRAAARDLGVEVYLQQADGQLRWLASELLPELGGDQEAYLDFTWDSGGQVGNNTVFVSLDSLDLIREGEEGNNLAAREFRVVGAPGLELQASLNRERFPADDVLNLELTMANSGPTCPIRVESTIEDGDGYPVAVLPLITKTLAYGAVEEALLAWSVGHTSAGEYRVRVVMRDGAGAVLAERLLPFTILADLKVRATLSSDALRYGPGQEVRLAVGIDNLGVNLMLPVVEVRLTVASELGEVHGESRQFTNLYSGAAVEFAALWPVGLSAPGNYTGAVTVWYLGQPVAAATVAFAVEARCALTGLLRVEPKVVPLGSPVNVSCGLNSSGNLAAGRQDLRVLLLDGLNQTVLAQNSLVAELGANDSWSGALSFAAELLSPGTFRVVFSRQGETGPVVLAEQTFSVADLTAPQLRVVAPLPGALLHGAPELRVAVSDNSGTLQTVEYRLDQGAWRPLPLVDAVTGLYGGRLSVGEGDEGNHLLSCRASDRAGNRSLSVSVAITLQPLLELAVAVSPRQAALGEELSGVLTVVNQGWAKSATLQTWTEDGAGVVLRTFPEQSLRLLADENRAIPLAWQVGTTPAGACRWVGQLLRNGAVAAAGAAEFAIQPTLRLAGSILPDRPSYGMDAPVQLAATLSSSGNFTIPLLTARLLLVDPAGVPVYTSEQEVADLTAGTSRTLAFAWNTGHTPAGRYTATLTLLVAGQPEAAGVGEVFITAVPLVTGILTPARDELPQGENLVVELAVSNVGNQPLAALPLRLGLVDAAGAVQLTSAWSPDLEIDAVFNRSEELVTQSLPPGSYRLRLECDLNGEAHLLAEAALTVVDVAPPQLTVEAPLGGAIITGPFALSVLAEDGGSGVAGVEYRLDAGPWLPLPPQASPGHFGLTWTPVAAEAGDHLLFFRATDQAGNVATSPPVSLAIELCTPFTALTGTLTYQPQPLTQGREVLFSYELANGCSRELAGLTVELQLREAPGNTLRYTRSAIHTLPPQSHQAGEFLLAAPGLPAGEYTATLRATTAEPGERELAVVPLTVLPARQITATVADRRHLLVWLNSAGGHDDDSDDDAEHDGIGNEALAAGPAVGNQEELLVQVLDRTGVYYYLARERADFEEQLRNPLVSDILILGGRLPLTDHYDQELREKINSGAGLIAAGWLPGADIKAAVAPEGGLLGVAGQGRYGQDERWRLQSSDSPITTAGEGPILSRPWRVRAEADASVAGWLVKADGAGDDDGDDIRAGRGEQGLLARLAAPEGFGAVPVDDDDDDEADDDDDDGHAAPGGRTSPALVLHQYGQGRTIYYAFDYQRALTRHTLAPLGGLLDASLLHVHREPAVGPSLAPLGVAPLRWEVTSPDGEGFRLRAALPPGLRLYDYQSDSWHLGGTWQSSLEVAAGQSGTLAFSILAPEPAGEFTLELAAEATSAGGQATPVSSERFSFRVASDRKGLLSAARLALDTLRVAKADTGRVKSAKACLEKVRGRAGSSTRDLEQNIHDLEQALALLLALDTPELPALRLRLDELLRLEESRWYLHAAGGCSDGDDHAKQRPECAGR